MIFELRLRRDAVGGPVIPAQLTAPGLSRSRALTELRTHAEIAFLVHGFNVNEARGRAGLGLLAERLAPALPGHALVTVLWPGDHWSRAASYPFEGDDADDSARELAQFIEDLLGAEQRCSFAAHSLGSRVVMETLKRLPAERVGQVCLMAAAIDNDCLVDADAYREAAAHVADRVAVLSSRRDRVLQLAYPLGDFLQSLLFFWRDDPGWALGLRGPRPKDAPDRLLWQAIDRERGADHGHYIPAPDASGPTADNQAAAARFAAAVLSGDPAPRYE
ncbi:MAG: alpha/beta hydrolase [Proteobacteria bacterium]|nr:alpha/beta hydrolase [Pseudomonadota bacterium]